MRGRAELEGKLPEIFAPPSVECGVFIGQVPYSICVVVFPCAKEE